VEYEKNMQSSKGSGTDACPPKKLPLAVAVAAALAVYAAATSEAMHPLIEPGVRLRGLNPGHDGHLETPQPSGPQAKQDQVAMPTASRSFAQWDLWPPLWSPTMEWPTPRAPLPLWLGDEELAFS